MLFNVHNILVMSLNLIIFVHLAVSDNVTPTLFLQGQNETPSPKIRHLFVNSSKVESHLLYLNGMFHIVDDIKTLLSMRKHCHPD